MKNLKIEKLFIVVLTILTLGMLICSPVLAADDDGEDEYEVIGSNNTNNNTNNENNNNNANNNVENNATNNEALNTNAVNNVVKNNTSNTASLPKTGVEDSLPIIILVVVFGVSAVYAYRKVQDYRDL